MDGEKQAVCIDLVKCKCNRCMSFEWINYSTSKRLKKNRKRTNVLKKRKELTTTKSINNNDGNQQLQSLSLVKEKKKTKEK
jgi:hypothetical protein